MHILLTRPIEDCENLIIRFRNLGHKVSHLPLIKVKNKKYNPINFSEYNCFIFTSSNALRKIRTYIFLIFKKTLSLRFRYFPERRPDVFLTFWKTGSTFSPLSGQPARRLPTFRSAGLTFSLLSATLGLPYAFAAISL